MRLPVNVAIFMSHLNHIVIKNVKLSQILRQRCLSTCPRPIQSAVVGHFNFLAKEEIKNKFNGVNLADLLQPNNAPDGGVFKRCVDNYENAVSCLNEKVYHFKSLIKQGLKSQNLESNSLDYEVIGDFVYHLKASERNGSVVLYRCRLPRTRRSSDADLDFTKYANIKWRSLVNFDNLGVENVTNIRVSRGVVAVVYEDDNGEIKSAKIVTFNRGKNVINNITDIGEIHFMPLSNPKKLVRVFYTVNNEQKRTDTLKTTLINTTTGKMTRSRTIMTQNDPTRYVTLYKSKDDTVLFVALTSHGKIKNAMCFNDAKTCRLYEIPLKYKNKGFLEKRGRYIYCVLNHGQQSKVYRISLQHLVPLNGRRLPNENNKCTTPDGILPPLNCNRAHKVATLDFITTNVDIFKSALICYGVKSPSTPGVAMLKFKANGIDIHDFKALADVGYIEPDNNCNWEAKVANLSLCTPGSLDLPCRIKLDEFNVNSLKTDTNIVSCIVKVSSHDGTCKIPVTLVMKSNLTLQRKIDHFTMEPKKCIVYVYGAYSELLQASNDVQENLLLDLGYILCFAHVRGGGELGENWHFKGTCLNKHNSTLDAIDVLQFLISKGITTPSLLSLYASSAGALIGGNVYTLRPDLCACIILNLPFLDVLDAILNEKQPLIQVEYEEFGNPFKKKQLDFTILDYIYSNSPCNTASFAVYKAPILLIQCNTNDSRAPFSHVVRFVHACKNPTSTLIKVSKGGHFEGDTYDSKIDLVAQRVAILEELLK